MSLINFAYSDLGCSIHCDAVSVDGYEINNILDGNKGFMTTGFIKPPVDIILSFPYWIELFALDLSPKVSAQCTQVASVYVSEHEWDPSKAVQLQNYFKPCITLNSLNNIGDNFVRLSRSRAITDQSGGNYAQMSGHNSYLSSGDEALSLIAHLPRDGVVNITPFDRNISLMHKVKAIKIRLQKSLNAGSLALKQVRIWAAYSRHNPPSLNAAFEQALQQHRARRQTFNQGSNMFSSSLNHLLNSNNATNSDTRSNMNHMLQPSYSTETSSGVEELNSSTRAMQLSAPSNTVGSFHVDLRSASMAMDSSENSPSQQHSAFGLPTNTEQAYGVPEKFLDPITFHLMTDPVILPSKHVVDRSTITRHLINHGTDPFTGLPMTAAQVLPDLALKADLDRYNSQRLLQQLSLSSSSIYATRLLPNSLLQQYDANSSKSNVLGSVSLPNLQLAPTNYSNLNTTPMTTTSSWLTNQNAALPNDHVACQSNGSVNEKGRGVKRRFREISPDMEDVGEDEERTKRARPARLCGKCSRDITWGVAYPCRHLTCRECVSQVPGSNSFVSKVLGAVQKSRAAARTLELKKIGMSLANDFCL